jgi:hypothetical protein
VQRLLAGTSLAVAPTLRGRTAVVDVVATFSEWDGPAAAAGAAAGGGATGPTTRSAHPDQHGLDRLDATVQHLATTAEMPLDKPVIVGGMTLRPRADDRGDRRHSTWSSACRPSSGGAAARVRGFNPAEANQN